MVEETIKEILVQRDRMSEDEAQELIDEVVEMIQEALAEGRSYEIDDIIAQELGLEPDYLIELIPFIA